ncbi:serine hydrolase [Flavobacteriaceae bacterium MHTCC 0001]
MKYLKWILALIIISLGVLFYISYPKLSVLNGYSSKYTTSGVYTAGRDFKSVDTLDNASGLIGLADDKLNREDKSVTSSVYGLNPRTSIYREGLGAVLLPKDYDYKPLGLKPNRNFEIVNEPYPFGHLDPKDTVFSNVNYKKLEKVVNRYLADGMKTTALLVLHKDHIVAEQYMGGFDENSIFLGWSMTKSITSTIYGVLHNKGKINVNDPAPITAWANDDRKQITINNLLQMNSGLQWEEIYDEESDATSMLFEEADMTKSTIDNPLTGTPNENWNYSSGTTNLLSGILRQQFNTHQEYLDFWYSELIDKIGMHSMIVETDIKGNYVGSSYGWATARDWAKLGTLYLHKGQWNDETIFNEDWYNYALTPTNTSNGRYGAQIWLNHGGFLPNVPKTMFSFNGFNGQQVFILPTKNLVVVRLGLQKIDFNIMLKEIVETID